LTNWGINQVKSDPEVAQGHVFYNLLMRALPSYYRGNSVYAMFPLVVPEENRKILKKLKQDQDYDFGRPSFIGMPTAVKSWVGVSSVLNDQARFKVPCEWDLSGPPPLPLICLD
jgi:linoleate 8R-lipoxygenase/9,12-octadecadienoate 8-hydroperoxide 8R-isomerase